MSDGIKSIITDSNFKFSRVGEVMRLTWGFETVLEKSMLLILLFLGLWKLLELLLNFIK